MSGGKEALFFTPYDGEERKGVNVGKCVTKSLTDFLPLKMALKLR